MAPPTCLDDNAVLAFVSGELSEGERSRVQRHVDACSDCRGLVAALARHGEAAEPAPAPALARAGAVLGGRYVLERPLGAGGAGFVWAARDSTTSLPVAVKVLRAQGAEAARRLTREARIALALPHPNVVRVHAVLEGPAVVMDLLEGEPLAAKLRRERMIPVRDAIALLRQVASAVAAAHAQGVVHRDLSAQNVFLVREHGPEGPVRVLDFGVAKRVGAAAEETGPLTRTGTVLGTPHFMAPEQVFGEKDVDARADVWALGVLAYRALSGELPVAGDSFGVIFKAHATHAPIPPLGARAPGLPPALAALVDASLARDRDARPADASRVLAELTGLAGA